MNELQLIQAQLSLERRHALEIAAECAGAGHEEFRAACAAYLEQVLTWFAARDARLADFAGSLPDRPSPPHGASGQNREALQLLAAARAGGDWKALAEFLRGPWSVRRAALEQWLAQTARIAGWRTVSALSADVILTERELYARTRGVGRAEAVRAGTAPEPLHGKG